MSVVWNVFMKIIRWADLGTERDCKNVKSFLENRAIVCVEIWAFSTEA